MNATGEDRITVNLPLTSCLLVDIPLTGLDCSTYGNQTECLNCPFLGRFISGEGMNEFGSISHVICLIMGVLVVFIGIFGAFANLIIMIILRRQNTGKGFEAMLVGLAGFDLICSVTSVITAISTVLYFQNWNRGMINVYIFWLGTQTAIFSRSGSSFQTVLITFERYLCVAFPFKTHTSKWFTAKKSQFMTFGIFIFSFVFLAFPRYSSHCVEENVYKHVESTLDVDYLIMSTRLEYFWYFTMGRYFDLVDFWAPLPILLVMNGLIYIHILRFTAQRKKLNTKERKDIKAVKMFLPVVIVLFLCNIIPIIDNICLVFYRFITREVYMGLLLSYVVNSAANLPIYYYRGTSFRKETRAFLSSVFPSLERYFEKKDENGGKVTTTGTASGASKSNDNEVGDLDKYF